MAVAEHYGRENLLETILAALRAAGKDADHLRPEDLAPLDEFHLRGRDASLELAELARLTGSMHVLDVGCGIGGPSHLLASEIGCRVTGIDITGPFVRTAAALAARLRLSDLVDYVQGDALHLPFRDGSFDAAWMQHVSMNIEDKTRLSGELHRVLRSGGRLALYEITAGSGEPLRFPVPWAKEASISFLVPADAMARLVEESGFSKPIWREVTEVAREFLGAALEKAHEEGAPLLGLHVLVGPRWREMAPNVLENLIAGRIRVVQGVAEKA